MPCRGSVIHRVSVRVKIEFPTENPIYKRKDYKRQIVKILEIDIFLRLNIKGKHVPMWLKKSVYQSMKHSYFNSYSSFNTPQCKLGNACLFFFDCQKL